VKEKILKLIALQDLDNKIQLWRQVVDQGPEKLAQARQPLETAKSDVDALKEKISENSKRRRELEAESADLSNRKTINQTRQLKARNNEEYRAVLKEADNIAALATNCDDVLLTLMDEDEKLRTQLPGLQERLESEEKLFEEKSQVITSTVEDGKKNLAETLKARETSLETIPQDLLSRYQTVAKNRNGQAMAPVTKGLCQSCRLSIPPQLFNELQKTEQLLVCPNCARIIYWTAHPHFKEFAPDEPPEPIPDAKTPGAKGRKSQAKKDSAKKVRAKKEQVEQDQAETDQTGQDQLEADQVEQDQIEADQVEQDLAETDQTPTDPPENSEATEESSESQP
jgi:predicted  nucleic acid-binding Zn-ribbon protein